MLRRIIATLLLLGVVGAVTSCDTMQAVGRGVEHVGEKIQDKAAQ